MNNPPPSVSKRYFTIILSGFLVCLLASYSLACASTPVSSTNGESDSVVGKPPPADSDPFAVTTLPADATPVAHQGTIDVDDSTSIPAVANEKAAVKALPAAPSPAPVEKRPEPGQNACFSCVQICKTENTSPDCNNAPQDMICGWGTAPELEQAKNVARAQCNATLDMAREMPMYSRIEGDCPPASCR